MKSRQQLRVEPLEDRAVPAAGEWLVEPFQRGPMNGLPSGWQEYLSGPQADFRVDPAAAGLGDTGRLTSAATSTAAGRAWLGKYYAADVEASAAVLLDSTASVQLLVRGSNLNTAAPNYYAAAVARGGAVQLVKVVAGKTTVLGSTPSAEYVSGKWVTVTIRAEGTQLKAFVHRGDTNQYLGPDGKWTRRPVAAVEKVDAAIKNGGVVGFARPAGVAGDAAIDALRIGSPRQPRTDVIVEERFTRGAAAGLPSGWSSIVAGDTAFRTAADETLRMTGGSTAAARVWNRQSAPQDVQVSASVQVDSLIPGGVFARGVNLYSSTPSYYSLVARRGLNITLAKTIGGRETVLATVKSTDYVGGSWVQISLVTSGTAVKALIYRADTGQYLNPTGTWSFTPAYAASVTDTSIRAAGPAGLVRAAGVAGEWVVDNVIVTPAPAGAVAAPIPTEQDKPGATPAPPQDTPTPLPPVVPPSVPPAVPPTVPPPPSVPPAVPPTVPTVPPATPANLPAVPRNYPHIRVANLAYYGTPMGPYEQGLLRNSIDLVIPNVAYLANVAAASPDTPQFVYTNVSNLYLTLYTDYLAFADKNRLNREGAFYHTTRAVPFTGLSASAVPVDHFWGVYGTTAGVVKNLTSSARSTSGSEVVAFGGVGDTVAVGYPEKFREMTVDVSRAAAGAWASVLEYPTAVDAAGKPTRWGTLRITADGTQGLKRDGKIEFDPPKDWVPASVGGSANLFYARFRTTAGGTAPVAASLRGRDYTNFTNSNGRAAGTIPAFDTAADRDGDGYLNDAEYKARRTGFDARFVYESRMFYPTYGPMRFATNPADAGFRKWVVDYHQRFLKQTPLATGFFVDNSNGKTPINPDDVKENLSDFAGQYGSLLGLMNRSLGGGKWVIANTAGGGKGIEELARNGVSYLEEFGLRPVSANHVQFDDLLANLTYRRQLSGGKAYEILDTLAVGIDAATDRVELAALAMYYAVADPDRSMLMMNGGNEPASSWTRHWTDAIPYNVGRPTNTASVFATGADPANRNLTYKIYSRTYSGAKVFYKPVSYTRGTNGTTADNTATTHDLGGWFRPLKADGSLGTPINRLTLRNGEGAILIPGR